MLARKLGLKHSTAHRILMVLTDMGLLRYDGLGHQFVLAGAVRELAAGFHDSTFVDEVALPRMRAWTRRHGLPLILVTESGGVLTVRASTDLRLPLNDERYLAGSVLRARGSSEARILGSTGRETHTRAVHAIRRRVRQGEIQLSVPLMTRDESRACLSIRCSLDLMRPRGSARKWAAALTLLAADIAAAADTAAAAETS